MKNAPDRIMAQDTDMECANYIGGGWWDELPNNDSTQYEHMTEYVRSELLDDMVNDAIKKAANELEMREKECANWFKETGNHANVYDQLSYARATILQGLRKKKETDQ